MSKKKKKKRTKSYSSLYDKQNIYMCSVYVKSSLVYNTIKYGAPVYLRFKLVYLVVGMVNSEVSHTDDDFVQQLFR